MSETAAALLESLPFVVIGGLAVALALYLALETWLRAWEQRLPSPLAQILSREGVDPQLAFQAVSRELAVAELRCSTCQAVARCREWLESGGRQGYHEFCPNAALVERLTAARAR